MMVVPEGWNSQSRGVTQSPLRSVEASHSRPNRAFSTKRRAADATRLVEEETSSPVTQPPLASRAAEDVPAKKPGPLFVVATPDQAQPHIDAMLAFIAQRAAAAKASSPDPSTPSTFKLDPDIEARFEAQDRLYHEGEEQPSPQPAIPKKGVALSLDTLPPYLGGVPGVDQCGYDDGTFFTPSADQNQGL